MSSYRQMLNAWLLTGAVFQVIYRETECLVIDRGCMSGYIQRLNDRPYLISIPEASL